MNYSGFFLYYSNYYYIDILPNTRSKTPMDELELPLKDPVVAVLQALRAPYLLQPHEAGASSKTRPIQPGVFLMTSCGQWVAGNREATVMLGVLGRSGQAQDRPALPPFFLTNFIQAMRRLELEQASLLQSALPTLRRTEEIEGRLVLLTGVLLPLLQSGDPSHVLVTMEWSTDRASQLALRPLGLARREKEIIVCLNQGLTNKEIAAQLVISTETVKEYLKRIMKKTNRRTRTGILGRVMPPT